MAKRGLKAAEEEVYRASFQSKTRPNPCDGKGLSSEKVANIARDFTDPKERFSLAGAAALLMERQDSILANGEVAHTFEPFCRVASVNKVEHATSQGETGKYRILWNPAKLAEVLGGSSGNWIAWTRAALDRKSDPSHLPMIYPADLGQLTRNHLLVNHGVAWGRREPVYYLSTTAMVAYLMAQKKWGDPALVKRFQEIVGRHADFIEPLLVILPKEDPAVAVVKGDGVMVSEEAPPEKERVTQEAGGSPVEEPLSEIDFLLDEVLVPLPQKVVSLIDSQEEQDVGSQNKTVAELRLELAQHDAKMQRLRVQLAAAEEAEKRTAWKEKWTGVFGSFMDGIIPDDEFKFAKTVSFKVGSEILTYELTRSREEVEVAVLTFGSDDASALAEGLTGILRT